METTENKKNIPLFVLKIILNVIFYAVIIMLLLFSIMNINAGSSNEGFPNIFGKGILSVQSDSMTRSSEIEEYSGYEIGSFSSGDLLFVDVIDSSKGDVNSLQIGDVITYVDEINGSKALNSHRIVYIEYEDDNTTVKTVTTQGDLWASQKGVYDVNDGSTWYGDSQIELISDLSKIKGKVTGVVSGGGKVLDNLQANWLFYFIVPVLIFLLIEIFLVVKNIVDLKNSKNKLSVEEQKEQLKLELEAEKEKMRQEILAEMRAKEEANNQSNTDNNQNTIENKEEPKEDSSTTNINAEEEPIVIEDDTNSIEPQQEEVEEPTGQQETVEETIEPEPVEEHDEVVESTADEVNVDETKENNEEVKLQEEPVEEQTQETEEAIEETKTEDVIQPENESKEDIKDNTEEKLEEESKDSEQSNIEENKNVEVEDKKTTEPKKTIIKKSASTTKKTTSATKKPSTTTKKTTSSTTTKKSTSTKKNDTTKTKKGKSE